MELLVSTNTKELSKYLKFTNSFIIGVKNFSVNYFELDILEIEKLLNEYHNINLFVAINKNIFNEDIKDLESILIKLSKLNIKGILFYDISILSIVKRLNLNIDLVYHQTHLVTNYNIVNFYKDLGCKYAYLSTEITEDEMNEISDKSNTNLMALFIGRIIISHSKRKLVSNYYLNRKKEDYKLNNIINQVNEDTKYYIKEDKLGTNILTYDILNGTKSFIKLKDKLKYGILDNNLIDDSIFLKVLNLYYDYLNNKINDNKFINDVSKLIGNYDGFFYTKTIYKVKK